MCISVRHCPKGVFQNSVNVGRSKRLLSRRMCFVLDEGRGKPVHTGGLSYSLDRIQWNFSCLGTLRTAYAGTLQSQVHWDCFLTLKIRYTLHGVHWNILSVRRSLGCTDIIIIIIFYSLLPSRDGEVGIATGYGLDD
jgi:hypothetical protein